MKVYKIFFLLSASLLMGCTFSKFGPLEGQNTVHKHIVQVDWDGNYYELPEKGKIDSSAGYNRVKICYNDEDDLSCAVAKQEQLAIANEHFKMIISNIETFDYKGGKRRIVIYIHGGLNTREKALERDIEKKPLLVDEGIYPIFINWRSGGFSSIKDHYFRIRDGEISRSAPLTSPVYIVGDIFRTVGGAPMAWWKEGWHAWKSSYDRERKDTELMQKPDSWSSQVKFAKDQKSGDLGRSALWWITSPAKIISTPVVHSLGKPGWDNMQRRVDTQFIKPIDFEGNGHTKAAASENEENSAAINSTAATMSFMSMLNTAIASDPRYEVTLIGHSMGGIVVNRILRNIPDLRVSNIVFMASADSLENFMYTTVPYVKRQSGKNRSVAVYNLHLHPENEDREVTAYGFAPSGSLLVWIDNAFGNPDYTLQRTAGRWSNMKQILPLIDDSIAQKFRFKVFGRTKNSCEQPQKHGEFDDCNYRFWDESYWF